MARPDRRTQRTPRTKARTARDEPLLSEVRWRLAHDERMSTRMRRLQSMEHAARIWVNGKELGQERPYGYLAAVHD